MSYNSCMKCEGNRHTIGKIAYSKVSILQLFVQVGLALTPREIICRLLTLDA